MHALIERAANQFQRLINVKRFGQVFEGAALKSRHRTVEIRVSGHDDDRQRRKTQLDLLQQIKPRLAGHADVRHQDLRRLGAEIKLRQRFARRRETLEWDLLTRQCLFEYPANRFVVIDNPNRFH